MRVLYIANWYNDIWKNLFNNLDKDINLTMILSDKFPKHWDNLFDIKVFPTTKISKIHEYLLSYKRELYDYILKEKPDLVICNLWFIKPTLDVCTFCKKNKIPYMIHTEMKRFPKNFLFKLLTKYLLTHYQSLISESKMILPWTKEAEDFAKKKFNISSKKISIISPGFDLNVFKKTEKSYNINKTNSNKIRILIVSRAVGYKRYNDMLKAYKIVKAKNNNFTLTIRAGGPLDGKIRKKVKKEGIKDVTFIDRIPYLKMKNLFSDHDILLLGSYNEAIGTVVPEALACGTPSVVSDTSGCKMYIINGKNALIFKTFDIKDMAAKILKYQNKDLIRKFGDHGINHIKNNYTAQVMGKKFSKVMKSI